MALYPLSYEGGHQRSYCLSPAVLTLRLYPALVKRIDYLNDPDAPAITSLVPSVNTVVVNRADDLLLIRRSDNGNWSLPGGAIELGESIPAAAVRETFEETGIMCEITGLVGTYSNPRHVILYTSNGEVRQEFSIVLKARHTSGTPMLSAESSEVRWVPVHELAALPMHDSMRKRINHFLTRRRPYVG